MVYILLRAHLMHAADSLSRSLGFRALAAGSKGLIRVAP